MARLPSLCELTISLSLPFAHDRYPVRSVPVGSIMAFVDFFFYATLAFLPLSITCNLENMTFDPGVTDFLEQMVPFWYEDFERQTENFVF